jgi:hypothetical protein
MSADELLTAMRPKLNDYYFDVLKMWLEYHKTYGVFKRKTKFEVSPYSEMGYMIEDKNNFNFIIVYDKNSWMCKNM